MGQGAGPGPGRRGVSRYLIAHIDVRLSEMGRFVETVGIMKEILTAAGWRMVGGFNQRTGLAGQVINIWELADFDQLDVGFGALAMDLRWPQIQAVLAEAVIRETVDFADALNYPAG
jgi:hypothetical protein